MLSNNNGREAGLTRACRGRRSGASIGVNRLDFNQRISRSRGLVLLFLRSPTSKSLICGHWVTYTACCSYLQRTHNLTIEGRRGLTTRPTGTAGKLISLPITK